MAELKYKFATVSAPIPVVVQYQTFQQTHFGLMKNLLMLVSKNL
jgi:hypothetical protein